MKLKGTDNAVDVIRRHERELTGIVAIMTLPAIFRITTCFKKSRKDREVKKCKDCKSKLEKELKSKAERKLQNASLFD